MAVKNSQFVRVGIVAAALLVICLCLAAARFAVLFVHSSSWVSHTTEVLTELRATRSMLGRPGVTPSSSEIAHIQIPLVEQQIEHIRQLTQDNPRQQANAADLKAAMVNLAANTSPDARLSTVIGAIAVLDRLTQEEYRLLAERANLQAEATSQTAISVAALCLTLLLVGLLTTLAAQRESARRQHVEGILEKEKKELTRYTGELALVAAGSELIQTATDERQLCDAVGRVMSDLLPGSQGYLGVISPSKDSVEVCAKWGSPRVSETFLPGDCMALQLGRQIHRSNALLQTTCSHDVDDLADFLCIPVRGPAGHLGVLHVKTTQVVERNSANAVALFAVQLSLSLSNLRMRETLRGQSVRDPLTGLFNRRYFDETLQRELLSYKRDKRPVTVLMFDVDHFKRFNDNYGHVAGDEALRGYGRVMRSVFRQSDVLCRYGGEEFAAILINTDLEAAYAKAEAFRILLARTDVTTVQGGERISTSIGVATCRDFCDPVLLVQAADAALYQAKRLGRNRTCLSREETDRASEAAPRVPVLDMTDTSLLNLPVQRPDGDGERHESGKKYPGFDHHGLTYPDSESPSSSASHSSPSDGR